MGYSQFSSVTQSCLTFCDSMDCSTPVHNQLLEHAVMTFHHLNLCHPLHLLSSIFPSIRVFSKESVLRIRWPKYWSFSISPSNEYSGLISFRIDCLISMQSNGLSRVFSNTTVQKYQFFSAQFFYDPTLTSIHGLMEKP